ncbi:hypothetical protein TNCV_3339741 [Trichonephila clavipes]|nr:hypothetical protein TNCV_3339741 [Trichonephila clavipes]
MIVSPSSLVVVASFPKEKMKSCQCLRQVELLNVCLLLALALSTMQVTVRQLARFHSILEGEHRGRSGASHLSSTSTNLTRRLETRRLFRVPTCRKGTIQLQTSMPSPGLEPRPYSTSVSVTNHYTEWATSSFL